LRRIATAIDRVLIAGSSAWASEWNEAAPVATLEVSAVAIITTIHDIATVSTVVATGRSSAVASRAASAVAAA